MAENVASAEGSGHAREGVGTTQPGQPHSDTGARKPVPEPLSSPQQGQEQSSGSSSCMTTGELQQYWKEVKSGRKPVKLLFEIPSTRTVEQALSKYVVYEIVVIKSGSYDSKQASVERRYSDFERLHHKLLQEFSEELEEVTFPKKRLMGNFAEENIAERRTAFKDYLAQLYAFRCIRRAPPFLDFFTKPELQRAYGCLRGGQYSRALEILQRALDLQVKLTQHCPGLLVPTLCAAMVCQRDLDELAEAFATGQRALPLVRRYGLRKYHCPLLAMLVDIGYQVDQPIAQLQDELTRVTDAQRGLVSQLSLKELVVQEFT